MKKILQNTALGASAMAASLIAPAAALAQGTVQFAPGAEFENLRRITVPNIITFIIRLLFIGAFIIAFLFLIIGGIRWILAGGDEKAVAQARGMVTGSIVGLVIIMAAFAIVRLIEFFFNISIITGGTITTPQIPLV